MLCMVMGTGQKGTWIFAESASARLPPITRNALWTKRVPGKSTSADREEAMNGMGHLCGIKARNPISQPPPQGNAQAIQEVRNFAKASGKRRDKGTDCFPNSTV